MAPQKGVTVASTDFPLYTIHMVDDSHFLVAGGGGPAKTGVPNAMEIYGLTPAHGSCLVTKVAFHHTPAGAAMNGCVATNKKREIISLFGINGMCYAYRLRSRTITPKTEGSVADGVRKRRGNLTESMSHKSAAKTLTFDLDPIGSVQTDFSHDGGYQKVVQLTPDQSVMVTGGADGKLRAWKFPDLEKLYETNAHTNEIDDLQIIPAGNRIVTIGKDNKAFVWNTKDGSKHVELHWNPQKDSKYRFRACRFSVVMDKNKKCVLYTTNVPLVISTKPLPCYITKWDTSKYVPKKVMKTGTEILSSMAMSDNGVFLGVGTMSGSVSVYISFSLQRLYHIKEVHNIFVTGLLFANTSETCQAITGNHDATLFSISADNQIKMHQVPAQGQIHPMMMVFFFALFAYLFYWIIVTLGL